MVKLDSLSYPKSVNEVAALLHFYLLIKFHVNVIRVAKAYTTPSNPTSKENTRTTAEILV